MAANLIPSPVGALRLQERDDAIVALDWGACEKPQPTPLLREAASQLRAYFDGRLEDFDLPLAPPGTDFEQRVFAAMSAIEYGHTRTYGDIALTVGASAQAVGQACGANPVAIIIPCHRVLAAKGLGGYSGARGVETKVALLKLERAAGLLI